MTQTIAGYELGELIHRSAASVVYRAVREADGHRVVVKTSASEHPSPKALDQLRREHAILERIDHPSVVRTFALEEHAKRLALVQEHCPGESLERLLGGEPLPLSLCMRLAADLADALAAVHAAGVLHRKVNPGNVLVHEATGALTLIDFGRASFGHDDSLGAVDLGVYGAGLPYVSPEQTGRLSRPVDERADLYAVGIVLYRMLTGSLPFSSDDPMELVHLHLASAPRPLREHRPDLPDVVEHIVLKLLAKTPEERYQSAAGLRADLVRCRDAEGDGSAIPDFEIATADVASRFRVPETLYGREHESQALLSAFESVAERAVLLLIGGYSGVGKSRLVQELQGPVVERRGYFTTGKFDQYKRNVPLASLLDAFRDLVRQILTEGDDAIAECGRGLQDALGANGQLILDVVPEVELLVGPQPSVPALPPREARNRFQQTLRAFVLALCRSDRPLCLFLDDLQWVDAATLGWLAETIPDPQMRGLLVVGAYRDNEVSTSHPLRVAVDRLTERGAAIRTLDLEPLPEDALTRLVADACRQSVDACRPFARLVHEKTGGNPFFVHQLLVSLEESGALVFDPEALAWQPRMERVHESAVSDNVVDLMIRRIRRLPAEAQGTMSLAACIGNRFDPALLAELPEVEADSIPADLTAALELGLLRGRDRRYAFVHDRVQQAAYSLLSEERARTARLHIGRRLLDRSADPAHGDELFDALQHLEYARELLHDDAELRQLAELNLAAAGRARGATAYAQALHYVAHAMDLIPAGEAPGRDELLFALLLERAECEHLAGNEEAADRYFGDALLQAKSDAQRAAVYEKKIHFLTNTARFDEAYATGREGAAHFGIRLPAGFSPPRFLRDYARIKLTVRGRPVLSLAELPVLSDPALLAGARLTAAALKAAYQVRPELCVATSATLVRLCLEHGNFDDCPVAYLPVGPIFQGGIRGNAQAGYDWGQLCIALQERFENLKQKSEIRFVYAYFAHSWTQSHESTEDHYRTAYQAGVETGDYFHASCASSAIVQSMYMRGVALPTVLDETRRYLEFVERVQSRENAGTLQAVRQTVLNLQGLTRGRTSYEDDDFDEAAYVATLPDYGSPHFAHYYFVNKLQAMYLWRELDAAQELAAASRAYLKVSPGMQHAAEHHFYEGLLAAALTDDSAGSRQRRRVRKAARRFARWAERCPENFLHKAQLLAAEAARLEGRDRRAASLYDQAIDTAATHGFQQNEALACELAARFHADREHVRSARHYLQDACYGYQRWGATALAEDADRRFQGRLGTSVVVPGTNDAEAKERVDATLDLDTIRKAAEAISSEVRLGDLLAKLLGIVIQNAGATRGLLFLPGGGGYRLQAEGVVGGAPAEVLQGMPLDDVSAVARSVVSYVVRTREPVVIQDAAHAGRFAADPHLAAGGPRSVLCAPLTRRGKISGVLYLENDLATAAFTEQRMRVLHLLSGQFAISIQNALVYDQMEAQVRERTAQLETRNRFIRQTFGRYLSEEIVENLLEDPAGLAMGGEGREITILFADLRGFSALCERLAPEQVVKLLNNHLSVMTDVILRYRGTIDEFLGDGVLAFFGAPIPRAGDAERAVACAVAMQQAMDDVNEANRRAGLPTVAMGIGLNTGEVVVGNIGSMKRAKYGAVGSNVNLAARIESFTTPGQILVSQRTLDCAGSHVAVRDTLAVKPKGVDAEVTLYDVSGIGGRHELHLVSRADSRRELATPISVRFQVLEQKRAVGPAYEATVRHLAEDGADLDSGTVPPPLTDIEIRVAGVEGPVYAKVVADAPAQGATLSVRFTSVAEEVRAFLERAL